MTGLRGRTSRLPLRVRLVAGFSVATLVLLVAAGMFVYWRVQYALDRGLDTELAEASGRLAPLVTSSGQVRDRDAADATGVAWQVLDEDGNVLARGGPARSTPMVGPGTLAASGTTTRTVNVGDLLPVSRAPYRLRVQQISSDPALYLLTAVRRDHRDEALRELLLQLVVAGVALLVITAFVGERLARAALRPVERYRRQAAAIAAGDAEMRLDVPPGRDDEVTRLGHTFNDMLAGLELALDRERRFVDEASHELRTPITLLGSRIQLARRRPRTQAEHEHILAELEVDLERLAGLAEQLLELGRSSASAVHGSTDLATTAERVVDQRRLADPGRATDLVLQVLAPEAPVPLTDVEVERVLTNLLDNATRHGAPPVEVTVDVPGAPWTRLTVSDAGPGMPGDMLESATRRFTRADEARARPGAGLGLSLVETLVTQAGGTLRLCHDGRHTTYGAEADVPCEHGPGMTITVLLPTVADLADAARQEG